MAEFSDYMEDLIIDHLLRAQAYSPVTVYVALFTAVTGLEASTPSAEVSGGAYAREVAGLSAASGGTSSNAGDITFTTATASWGTVGWVALVDHISNTNWGTDVEVLMWSALDTSKDVDDGDTFKFNATELAITID